MREALIETLAALMKATDGDEYSEYDDVIKKAKAALTAAAEVGLPVDLMIKDAVDAAIAATIERCAQEIEGRYFKHINDAAAAIRALKDKP